MMMAPPHVRHVFLIVFVALALVTVRFQTTNRRLSFFTSETRQQPRPLDSWSDSGDDYLSRTKTDSLQEAAPTFVIVMGLEGTGHHLLSAVLSSSPAVQELDRLNLLTSVRRLRASFFNLDGSGSMVAPCHSRHNVTASHERSVQIMKQVASSIASEHPNEPFYVPVNAYGRGLMMSYPTGYACNRMQYPLLDHFYRACGEAHVQCAHVYIRRDPHAIISSTTVKRQFNPSVLEAVHLYTTFLHILHAQLSRYSHHNLACIDLYGNDGSSVAVDTNISDSGLLMTQPEGDEDSIAHLFGWKDNLSAFREHLKSVVRPSVPMTREEKANLIPEEASLFMDFFQRTNQEVWELCRKQVRENRDLIGRTA